ncbi:hypothetical protein ACWA5Z_06855 [Testudinibacter sp. P80/BLE/0925]
MSKELFREYLTGSDGCVSIIRVDARTRVESSTHGNVEAFSGFYGDQPFNYVAGWGLFLQSETNTIFDQGYTSKTFKTYAEAEAWVEAYYNW